MELRELEKVTPMTIDFFGLTVTFNPDAFTDGFFYAVADRFRNRFSEEIKSLAEPKPEPGDEPISKALAVVDQFADRIQHNGDVIKREKDFFIALLIGTSESPVLLSWELTRDGVPVPCNEEGLQTLKHGTLKALWETVRDAPYPKSQTTRTSLTTSETMQSPSASPATHKAEDPIM